MGSLIANSNVRGYLDKNGTAHLNLEDVARGLGFTTVATSGNECVRWERVRGYLVDMKFIPASGDAPEFIPENIFYRLAMKAKNETAEAFQIKVADEILPSIRKTGQYTAKPLSQLEILAQATQALVEQDKQLKAIASVQAAVSQEVTTIKHRLDSLDTINIEGTLKQRLNAMVRKYSHSNGVLFNVAWRDFINSYNMAYTTNLRALINNYKAKHGLKELTVPQYLSLSGRLEDAVRVADKLLNVRQA